MGKSVLEQDKWELSRKTLVSILTESHYSPGEFADALGSPSFTQLLKSVNPFAPWGIKTVFKAAVLSCVPKMNRRFAKECGLGLFAKRCWEIQSYTFSYRSQTTDGRNQTLSGRVTFLNNRDANIPHRAKTISLHVHQAFFNPEWAPSRSLMYVPLKVMRDSVVIEPDLQKWGITHGIESDGSGSAIRTARQIADCVVAALEIMRQHHVELAPEGYTTLWGGSQGAMPTLCFDKWYDTEAPQWFKEELRLRSSFIVEGVAKVHVLTTYIYQNGQDYPLKPVTLVGYLKAFTPEQLGGYKPQELVPQWWNDTKFQVNGREISFFDAVCHYIPEAMFPLSDTISCYAELVAPDMLTPDGQVDMECPKIKAWLECLRVQNDLSGWTPEHAIYIAHSPADDMFPYEYTYDQYMAISNGRKNPKVHMLNVPSMRLVPRGGMKRHFILAFMGQMTMAFVENPEGMQKIFKSVQ